MKPFLCPIKAFLQLFIIRKKIESASKTCALTLFRLLASYLFLEPLSVHIAGSVPPLTIQIISNTLSQ